MNERFQKALSRTAQVTPPIWFMRQAGRYHSHYQNLKSKYTFMQLCKQPELAAQVALGPIQDFDFDVSILFSDLLFPLEALGFGLDYSPGPVLSMTLTKENLKKLRPLEEAKPFLNFQHHAMRATREVLPKEKSLIGFVGGPWTLFTYASEGEHKGSLISAKTQFELYREFSAVLLPLLKHNIQIQFDGGAEVVMIFDTASGELDPQTYSQLCLPHLTELARAFPGRVGYYSKGTTQDHLRAHMGVDWAGIGVDHRWDLTQVFKLRTTGFVQGNFDQALLFLDQDQLKKTLDRYLQPMVDLSPEARRGWVCGLGHGILPKTPEANVRLFIETVRKRFS